MPPRSARPPVRRPASSGNLTPPAARAPAPGSPESIQQALNAAERFRARATERQRRAELQEQGLWLQLDTPARVRAHVERLATAVSAETQPSFDAKSMAVVLNEPAPTLDAALERIIGGVTPDLLRVNYFPRGSAAARAVARINTGAGESFGTGFLVSPRLLLTNHHVLPTLADAKRSVAEFDFEYDEHDRLRPIVTRQLDPQTCYISNPELDFALVAVALEPGDAERIGVLRLLADQGKIIIGEPVTIVQHPKGNDKQVAVRNNDLLDVLEDFLHYETDTEPGASGSPVFNNQWEVVALHHSGVPATDENGNMLKDDGSPWTAGMDPSHIKWVANEGVRISRIVRFLQNAQLPPGARQLVNEIFSQESIMPVESPTRSVLFPPRSQTPPTGPSVLLPPAAQGPTPAASPATLDVGATGVVIQLPERFHLTMEVVNGGTTVGEATRGAVEEYEGWLNDVVKAVGKAVSSAAKATGGAVSTAAGWVADRAKDLVGVLVPGGGPPPPVAPGALQTGDVLLYQGRGVVSEGIMFFTESSVSHAALYLGNDVVGEAIANGLVKRSRTESFSGANWVIARRLPNAIDMQPVIGRANVYLDQSLKYAYHQIVLLALLLITKKTRGSGVLGPLIQTAAAAAASIINRMIESRTELMICSEFVFRAYDEASNATPDPFALSVPGVATRESTLIPGVAASGIDPDSVLARLQSHPELLRAAVPEAVESVRQLSARPIPYEALEAKLETLLAEHMAEVRYARPVRDVAQEAYVSDQSIAAAVTTLALAFDAMEQAARGQTRESVLAEVTRESATGLPAALQRFFQTAADFVTPEDLRRSPSLRDGARAY